MCGTQSGLELTCTLINTKKRIIFKRLLQKYVSDATAFDLSVTPDENVVIQLYSFSFKLKLSS